MNARGPRTVPGKGKEPLPARRFYPIRTVAQLTGINPATLRAWERRYGLLKPKRTPRGHRLYTEEHVRRIRTILDLVAQGISIGQVRHSLDPEPDPDSAPGSRSGATEDPWAEYRSRMRQAASRYDEDALDAVYNDCLSLYPIELVSRLLMLPMLREMQDRLSFLPASEPQTRFFRSYLRNQLGARIHHQRTQARGVRLMGACLPEEFDETGLLLFSLAALSRGYRVALLGPNVPLDGLALAVERSGCRGLVLYSDAEPPVALLQTHLPALAAEMRTPLFLAGAAALQHREHLRGIGCVPLVGDLAGALTRLEETLHPAETA